jgi:hypothetical protein
MKFAVPPGAGEFVLVPVANSHHAFEVVRVIHPSNPMNGGADNSATCGLLWVVDRGEQGQWEAREMRFAAK